MHTLPRSVSSPVSVPCLHSLDKTLAEAFTHPLNFNPFLCLRADILPLREIGRGKKQQQTKWKTKKKKKKCDEDSLGRRN